MLREIDNLENKILKLASIIKKSKNVMVLTGAGMDTESNIPDFRSRDGWWKNIDPMSVASKESLINNYDLFHEFYSYRIKKLSNVKLHKGHYVLAKLEKSGFINCIATQNVSSLHIKSGSKRVYELHGNINNIKCDKCESIVEKNIFLSKKRCKNCGSALLRPQVTLFGEQLSQETWNNVMKELRDSELLIVIGTSLQVYPANEIPNMFNGVKVYINNESCSPSFNFHLSIIGTAKDILTRLYENLLS